MLLRNSRCLDLRVVLNLTARQVSTTGCQSQLYISWICLPYLYFRAAAYIPSRLPRTLHATFARRARKIAENPSQLRTAVVTHRKWLHTYDFISIPISLAIRKPNLSCDQNSKGRCTLPSPPRGTSQANGQISGHLNIEDVDATDYSKAHRQRRPVDTSYRLTDPLFSICRILLGIRLDLDKFWA